MSHQKINNDMYDKADEIFIENIKQYNVRNRKN